MMIEGDGLSPRQEGQLSQTKLEVTERLGRVFESFMKLGERAKTGAQYKDAAASFQLAGNVALTIASIKNQPGDLQNDLSANIQFDEED